MLSLLGGLLAAGLGGLILAVFTVTLGGNQIATGLAFTLLCVGLCNFAGGLLAAQMGGVGQVSLGEVAALYRQTPQFVQQLGDLGRAVLGHGFLAYLSLALALGFHVLLWHTKTGLRLRAVGENPATATAAGISVKRTRYFALCLGGSVAGLGGLAYTMDYAKGTWAADGTLEGLGWLSLALVLFSGWRFGRIVTGALAFSGLTWLYLYLPGLDRASQELVKLLPYVAAMAALVLHPKARGSRPPKHLGKED